MLRPTTRSFTFLSSNLIADSKVSRLVKTAWKNPSTSFERRSIPWESFSVAPPNSSTVFRSDSVSMASPPPPWIVGYNSFTTASTVSNSLITEKFPLENLTLISSFTRSANL
uniref:Uncharacterized protein n=1 Tax=Lotus japonicus TaxID=34305 RepID=I3T0M1_LOTJA|nr:unknown [Lotus japonicus]